MKKIVDASSVPARYRSILPVLLGLLSIFCVAHPASANTIVLTDGSTSLTLDPESQSGISDWTIHGVDVLAQQWFWFRIGSNPLQSLDALGTPTVSFDPGFPDSAQIDYTGQGLNVQVLLTLVDGNPLRALGITVAFNNLDAVAKDLTIFQYINFDLSASDTALFTDNHTVDQSGGGYSSEVVVLPIGQLDHRRVDLSPVILNALNGAGSGTFNLVDNSTITGDATSAFQWHTTLAASGNAGSSFQLSITEQIAAPEPGSMLLAAAGLLALYGARQRLRR